MALQLTRIFQIISHFVKHQARLELLVSLERVLVSGLHQAGHAEVFQLLLEALRPVDEVDAALEVLVLLVEGVFAFLRNLWDVRDLVLSPIHHRRNVLEQLLVDVGEAL